MYLIWSKPWHVIVKNMLPFILPLNPSSYIERDKQQRQDSEFRNTANPPSRLIEERFSETGSKILPLTDFFNQRLVLKLCQLTLLNSSPRHNNLYKTTGLFVRQWLPCAWFLSL